MAGDWIKWTKGLTKRREVLGIAARLEITPAHAAGLCMEFWEWLDDNIGSDQIDKTSNVINVTGCNAFVTLGVLQPDFLDTLLSTKGFANALVSEGWLSLKADSFIIPNYTRHNSQTAKTRALTNERVAKSRGKKQGKKRNAKTVTKCNAFVTPKRREEKSKVKEPTKVGSKTSRFVVPLFEEVQSYCRQRKNQVDPQAFIDHYESNGWKVGRNAMKDWKAAVRTWEKNDYRQTNDQAAVKVDYDLEGKN